TCGPTRASSAGSGPPSRRSSPGPGTRRVRPRWPRSAMSESHPLGVIALVPDAWQDIVMARHQVMQRLALHFPILWMEPAHNSREHIAPFGPRFLAPERWSEPARGMQVLDPGWRRPKFYRLRHFER